MKPMRPFRILKSVLATTVAKTSSTLQNSLAVVASAVVWAAWARKSTPKSFSRCLVDRWAVAASEVVVWVVVVAEEVVVASLAASTLVERALCSISSNRLSFESLDFFQKGTGQSLLHFIRTPLIRPFRFSATLFSRFTQYIIFGMTEQAK